MKITRFRLSLAFCWGVLCVFLLVIAGMSWCYLEKRRILTDDYRLASEMRIERALNFRQNIKLQAGWPTRHDRSLYDRTNQDCVMDWESVIVLAESPICLQVFFTFVRPPFGESQGQSHHILYSFRGFEQEFDDKPEGKLSTNRVGTDPSESMSNELAELYWLSRAIESYLAREQAIASLELQAVSDASVLQLDQFMSVSFACLLVSVAVGILVSGRLMCELGARPCELREHLRSIWLGSCFEEHRGSATQCDSVLKGIELLTAHWRTVSERAMVSAEHVSKAVRQLDSCQADLSSRFRSHFMLLSNASQALDVLEAETANAVLNRSEATRVNASMERTVKQSYQLLLETGLVLQSVGLAIRRIDKLTVDIDLFAGSTNLMACGVASGKFQRDGVCTVDTEVSASAKQLLPVQSHAAIVEIKEMAGSALSSIAQCQQDLRAVSESLVQTESQLLNATEQNEQLTWRISDRNQAVIELRETIRHVASSISHGTGLIEEITELALTVKSRGHDVAEATKALRPDSLE